MKALRKGRRLGKEMKSLEQKLTMAGRKLPLDEHWPYKHILNIRNANRKDLIKFS